MPGKCHSDAFICRVLSRAVSSNSSARFKRLLSSGAVVFKSTITSEFGRSRPDGEPTLMYAISILEAEWWNQRAQAWVHYVPIKIDYSDMYDSIAFVSANVA